MIRVLVIDSSVVARRLISSALENEKTISVVGTTPDSKSSMRKINQVRPDLVVIDPYFSEEVDFEILQAMRKEFHELPILLFSSATHSTLLEIHARTIGKSLFIEKPSGSMQVDNRKMLIASILTPGIHELIAKSNRQSKQRAEKAEAAKTHSSNPRVHRIDVVAIGVSTGGPAALAKLMPALPKNLPVPIVIVQHMPADFTKKLATRLNDASAIPIYEGKQDDELHPGAAWLAPGGYHMVVNKDINGVHLDLNLDPPEEGCRPAVDVMFRSVARVFGPNALAVIMTGMGKDGLEGSRAILKAGGRLLAQDKESSVIWGMPGAVTKAGLPEKVAPLDQLGYEIVSRVKATQSLSIANRR